MPDIQSIKIDGFKGLTDQVYTPKTINLITGRNNTGKTSLLEAIHLTGKPEGFSGYNEKIFSLINKHSENCKIHLSSENQDVNLRIEKPTKEERKKYLIEGITKFIFTSLTAVTGILHDTDEEEGLVQKEHLRHVLMNKIAPEINLDKDHSNRYGSLKVILNDKVHPIFYRGASIKETFDISTEDILNLISDHMDEKVRKKLLLIFDSSYSNQFRGSYFLDKPRNIEGIQFIEKDLTGTVKVEDEDQKAVKVTEIEDYLKKYGLVKNLESFDLDYLVFQEQENKRYQVPFEFMGDGFQAIVHLLWELLDEGMEEKIVLLEEPENHMHPGYIQELVHFLTKTAREQNIQFFITTHNQDFLGNFFEETYSEEHRNFLQEEFALIQMQQNGFSQIDYETAEKDLNELYLDLRSI